MQLCAGQEAGCEAEMHAMGEIFRQEETDALLFVDATNAFTSLNRNTMIHNIQYLCPQWLYMHTTATVHQQGYSYKAGKKYDHQKARLKGII